jgi:hypothetical protein
MTTTFTLPAPPPTTAPVYYAAIVVAVGERVWGRNWPAGMAHMIDANPRTLQRLQQAARAGRDYRGADAILAQVQARLGEVASALRPWTEQDPTFLASHNQRARAERLVEATADAYSFEAYGQHEWLKAIGYLMGMGYDDRQIEAVLRSKWTRWASDAYSTYDGKGRWLKEFVERHAGQPDYDIDALVAGTFQ